MASNTYVAVGNKPDVSEIITNIAPYDTPLWSMIGRTKATAVTHEWLEDDLGGPQKNVHEEGFTYDTSMVKPRKVLFNYTQIMERGVHVTGTQEAVLHYGVKSEMAYQMNKTMKELAFDCEWALLNNEAPVKGTVSKANPTDEDWQATQSPARGDQMRELGGLPYWAEDTVNSNVDENGGTLRPLTFTLINSILQTTWENGGKPSILLVSPINKRVISSFTVGSTKYIEANKEHKISHYIDVIETDFGVLKIYTDRFMSKNKVYGLSPEYMKKAFLRPFRTGELPKAADMYRKNVYGEWTLEMRAPKAHFSILDLDGLPPTV